jgi:hypothetical protein
MSLYDLTISRVKDTSGKLDDPTDYENNIAAAIAQYSKNRPRFVCADVAGQDGPDIALPPDWAEGVSIISAIEYPIGDVPESLIEPEHWRLYRTPTDTYIRFDTITPAADQDVRLLYTVLHTEATIPAADLDAVADLAASKCCRQLAAAFGQTNDPTIQADSVNYRTKSGEFTALANKLEAAFKSSLGLRDGDTTPAASAVTRSQSTRPRLTHGG